MWFPYSNCPHNSILYKDRLRILHKWYFPKCFIFHLHIESRSFLLFSFLDVNLNFEAMSSKLITKIEQILVIYLTVLPSFMSLPLQKTTTLRSTHAVWIQHIREFGFYACDCPHSAISALSPYLSFVQCRLRISPTISDNNTHTHTCVFLSYM